MRVLSLVGALWAQSVCVWVSPVQKELRTLLRAGQVAAEMRQRALWRGFVRAEAVSPDTTEAALGGWFVLHFAGEDTLQLLERLQASGFFQKAELLRGRRLHSGLYGWHHLAIQTAQAWMRTYGSPAVPIAILDTGIDTGLVAFSGQYYINPAEDRNGNRRLDPGDLNGIDDDQNGYIDDVIGYDFTDQGRLLAWGDAWQPDPLPIDENGHGTAMASVIAAKPGASPVQGIAPGCPVLIVRAFSADGYGEDDDIVRGILYAVRRGARVISCSFGDEVPSQMMAEAIRYAVSQGVVVVASSGNGVGARPHYPSGFPEVISVGAVSFDPERGSYFLWPLSGYSRVDWVAPGDQVPVLLPGGLLRSLSGTSLSAAITSAAVALLLSQHPTLSPEEVRATLASAALDVGSPGWDIYTGSGLLRLPPALDYPQSGFLQWLSPLPNGYYGLAPLSLRFRLYHSLLSSWEISWAPALQGPWLTGIRGSVPTWDTTILWTPPAPGRWFLRITAFLRNRNALTALCPIVVDTARPTFLEASLTPTWQENRLGYGVTYRLSAPLPVCLSYTGGQQCFDRVDTTGAAWIGTPSLPVANLLATNVRETVTVSLSTPPFTPSAIGIDNHQIRALTAPAGYYWPEPLPDWDGDGFRDLLATRYAPDGTYDKIIFLSKRGNAYRPYDSIPRAALARDLADWDNDGVPELLCVWYDSFFVYGGSPPKSLLYAGKGLAARLEYLRSIWVRTAEGHYEARTLTGQTLRRLSDTTTWNGSTTIPRILKVRRGNDSLWVFGNYAGYLFAYDHETLLGTYHTGLQQVGSHLYPVDLEGDGYEEILYLGSHPSGKVWRLGLLSPDPWQEISHVQFWVEGNIRPRLLLRGDGRFVLWLPPQIYFGRLTPSGFVWEAYGPWAWDACTPVDNGWLLGIDTLPRVVEFIEGLLPPPAWKKAGALTSTTVLLEWHPLPGASAYEVWRFQPRQNPTRIYAGSGSATIDVVGPGDTCYYAVRAVGGAFGELRRIIPGPRPCFTVDKVLPEAGQLLLTSLSQWAAPSPEAFRLHPTGIYPTAAIGSGAHLALYFSQPLSSGTYELIIDTLLTDEYGRFFSSDCDTLPFTIPPQSPLTCRLPLRWEVLSDNVIEISFSAPLPAQAETLAYYQLLPVGQVLGLERPSASQLRLTLSVSPRRQPLSLIWSWDTTGCPRAVSFSSATQTLMEWGVFPNPVRGQSAISFWGLPPQTTISILTPSGNLCTRFRTSPQDPLPSWNLQDLTGKRLQPGLYLILVEYEGQKVWEKLYIEE
jgi:subtilisin family serine protease